MCGGGEKGLRSDRMQFMDALEVIFKYLDELCVMHSCHHFKFGGITLQEVRQGIVLST